MLKSDSLHVFDGLFSKKFLFYCGILGRQKEKSLFEKTGKNLYLCAVFCIFNFVEDTLVLKILQ